MKESNKKLKSLYDYETPLDLEKEWAAIEARLEPKKKRPVIFFWWLLPLAGALSLVLFFLLKDSSQSEHSVSPKQWSSATTTETTEKAIVNTVEKNESTNTPSIDQTKNSEAIKQETAIKKTYVASRPNQTTSTRTLEKIGITNSEAAVSKNDETMVHSTMKTADTGSPLHVTMPINVANEKTIDDYADLSSILTKLPLLTLKKFGTPHPTFSIGDINITKVQVQKADAAKDWWLTGSIGMGISNSDLKSNTTENNNWLQARQNTETSLEYLHSSIQVSKVILGDHIYFKGGLGWIKVNEKFAYSNTNINTQYIDNQIVEEYTNTNGVKEDIIGKQEVNEVTTIKKLKYNAYQRVEIPIALGFQHRFKRWQLSYDVGVGIPVYQTYTGQILNSSKQVAEIDQAITLSKMAINLNQQASIEYALSPTLSLGIQVEHLRSMKPINTDDTKQYYQLSGGTIQLKFRL